VNGKGQFIPIAPLKNYLIIHYMKKAAATHPFRVFPFQYRPLAILKNLLRYTNHFGLRKFLFKHFFNRPLANYRLIYHLVVDGILRIQITQRINGRVGKGISAQASHKTVLETLASHGFSQSVVEDSTTLLD
jgi:hypothetical protein